MDNDSWRSLASPGRPHRVRLQTDATLHCPVSSLTSSTLYYASVYLYQEECR